MHPAIILARMLKTGQFFPSADWAKGRDGMDWDKFNVLWKTIAEPDRTTVSDVRHIFSSPFHRYTAASGQQLGAYDLNEVVPDGDDTWEDLQTIRRQAADDYAEAQFGNLMPDADGNIMFRQPAEIYDILAAGVAANQAGLEARLNAEAPADVPLRHDIEGDNVQGAEYIDMTGGSNPASPQGHFGDM